MSFAEDEYRGRRKKKNPLAPFLPLLGLVLAVALAAVAFILSAPVHDLLKENIADFPVETEVQYVIAVVLFIVLVLFAGMLYAAFAPKPPKLVSESELKRERIEIDREKRAKKKRRRELARKASRERERGGR